MRHSEPVDQIIVRYLGGLDPKYSNVVELQQYTKFDEVCMLAHRVEQQHLNKPFERNIPETSNSYPTF